MYFQSMLYFIDHISTENVYLIVPLLLELLFKLFDFLLQVLKFLGELVGH